MPTDGRMHRHTHTRTPQSLHADLQLGSASPQVVTKKLA